jgi:hypothetical protein
VIVLAQGGRRLTHTGYNEHTENFSAHALVLFSLVLAFLLKQSGYNAF